MTDTHGLIIREVDPQAVRDLLRTPRSSPPTILPVRLVTTLPVRSHGPSNDGSVSAGHRPVEAFLDVLAKSVVGHQLGGLRALGRLHYEIAPLDTGEGGIIGYQQGHQIQHEFESDHLSGTAVALYPAAYPAGGSEQLWPHQEVVVRDILLDCDGTVVWGGDLTPAKLSHFALAVGPGQRLARVAARLDTSYQPRRRTQTAGTVADPATSECQEQAAALSCPQ